MRHDSNKIPIEAEMNDETACHFVKDFLTKKNLPKFVFGCNQWAQSIAKQVEIDGFVDDFTSNLIFFDKPVIRSSELPKSAIVVSAIVGEKPLTAQARLLELGVKCLDYYAFHKYSKLALKQVMFLGDFETDFNDNLNHYEWLWNRITEEESRRILARLLNFRLSRNLRFMDGFVDAQDRQYFEPFLQLQKAGETFLDIGCYDGYTAEGFIRRCPDYAGVHVFEPEMNNMLKVRARLERYRDIHYHEYGASSAPANLRFHSNGSSSGISNEGDLEIRVERIDDVVEGPFSFLKIDIEGEEIPALHGAAEAISRNHPRLAISVYHRADDLWRIPKTVFEIRDDYDLYLRHYTEGVTETVMFFIPRP